MGYYTEQCGGAVALKTYAKALSQWIIERSHLAPPAYTEGVISARDQAERYASELAYKYPDAWLVSHDKWHPQLFFNLEDALRQYSINGWKIEPLYKSL